MKIIKYYIVGNTSYKSLVIFIVILKQWFSNCITYVYYYAYQVNEFCEIMEILIKINKIIDI